MLTLSGNTHGKLCDGIARRDFLRIGGLAMGGFSLPELLKAEAEAKTGRSFKSVIMIYMCGAPPHQDMWDLKMDAPLEIRGPYKPIKTAVPGIHISEHAPRLAKMMDKLVPIRSMYGSPTGAHDSFICYTGRAPNPSGGAAPTGRQSDYPSFGSTISYLQGQGDPAIPSFVGLAPKAGHPPYGSPGHPGYLGPAHSAFRPNGAGVEDLKLNGITLDRLEDRRSLLTGFDNFRRELDQSGLIEGMDAFNQQAMNVLTSSKLLDALDISKESTKTRERYGKGDPKNYGDGAPLNLEHFLMARRLVEAGARVVTLNFGRWDFHDNNYPQLLRHLPLFDQGMSALVEDLHQRGLDKDVAVIAWGEFGRTPTVNAQGGRDHWPRVGGALLAGGGLKTGQVIGATDRLGGEATERPVHFGEVFATLYKFMGIDTVKTTLHDLSGRPQYLVDGWQPMPELI
ncbi:MAG: DUF1501 domain-containing protein [Verrucomicrobiaceae bacterium]|nr:DUF1501 domain-containing protein [Verrucomicrobiaceae bacterium]